MSYIQITGRTYINPRHIVSIDIEEASYTHITGEYTDKAKGFRVEKYALIIKMSNGVTYTEAFEDREKARERRDNLSAHW